MTEGKEVVHDMMDRPFGREDFVVYYSGIYQVHSVSPAARTAKIILVDKQKTTHYVTKAAEKMALLDKNEVLLWMLKRKVPNMPHWEP